MQPPPNPNQPPYNPNQPPYNPNQPQGYNPNQPPGYPNNNPNYQPQPPYQNQPYYGQNPPPAPRKKGMSGCLIAVIVVVAVFVVLGVLGVVTGVVTGSISFGPMQVTDATMAKGFANNEAVNPSTTFSPTDNPLYCVVKIQNPTAGAVLKGTWTAVDAGGAQNRRLPRKP